MSEVAISGWAYKVLAKTGVSLKQAAWAFGCAKKGSEEERLLLERFWVVVERERASQEAASDSSAALLEARRLLGQAETVLSVYEQEGRLATDTLAGLFLPALRAFLRSDSERSDQHGKG